MQLIFILFVFWAKFTLDKHFGCSGDSPVFMQLWLRGQRDPTFEHLYFSVKHGSPMTVLQSFHVLLSLLVYLFTWSAFFCFLLWVCVRILVFHFLDSFMNIYFYKQKIIFLELLEVEANFQFMSPCHLLYTLENCTVGNALHFSCVRWLFSQLICPKVEEKIYWTLNSL